MEELYFFCTHHALMRGYSVLVFDGPGQGGTILESGTKISHNYDEVLVSVLHVATKYGMWRRIVVMGLSLGGLLCLKAVSGRKTVARVHAVIADPAELNLIDGFCSCIPFPQTVGDRIPESPAWAGWLLDIILNRIASGQSLASWSLRCGMLVHGRDTSIEYVKSLHEFDNEPILEKIKIPVLIARAQKRRNRRSGRECLREAGQL